VSAGTAAVAIALINAVATLANVYLGQLLKRVHRRRRNQQRSTDAPGSSSEKLRK